MSVAPPTGLAFREGGPADLRTTFELSQRAVHSSAQRMGITTADPPDQRTIARGWTRHRDLLEFIAAQGGSCWICEEDDRAIGYGRVCRFGEMEELTELMVAPSHQGRGIGRALLTRCWPDDPSPDMGRVVIAMGTPADLSLYSDFGVMPITGHWHMRANVAGYQEQRSNELDVTEPAVHVLEPGRAVSEWTLLEPPAVGHRRRSLHEFFSRTRSCLATMNPSTGRASAVCWVGSDGAIGPAVGATPADLVPVVLAALDRIAKAKRPESFSVLCATDSWWLLRRLRRLGFRVHAPSWIMASVPLPGLDRYLPTRPAYVL